MVETRGARRRPLKAVNSCIAGTIRGQQALRTDQKEVTANESLTLLLKEKIPFRVSTVDGENAKKRKKNRRVRFRSVQVLLCPRRLGDFMQNNNQHMDYALALDWPRADGDRSAIITYGIDAYEKSKTSIYRSPVEYSELGRLNVSQRCMLLLTDMGVSDLALQVGRKQGKTTTRGIARIAQELQVFLESVLSSPTIAPPFVEDAAIQL